MNKETIQGFTVECYDSWKFCQDEEQNKVVAQLPHLAYDELLHHRSMERGKVYRAQLTLDVSNQDMEVPRRPAYLGEMFKHNFVETTDKKNVFCGWIVRTETNYSDKDSLTFYLEHPGPGIQRWCGICFGYGMFWHPMPADMLRDSTPLNTPLKCLLTIELI